MSRVMNGRSLRSWRNEEKSQRSRCDAKSKPWSKGFKCWLRKIRRRTLQSLSVSRSSLTNRRQSTLRSRRRCTSMPIVWRCCSRYCLSRTTWIVSVAMQTSWKWLQWRTNISHGRQLDSPLILPVASHLRIYSAEIRVFCWIASIGATKDLITISAPESYRARKKTITISLASISVGLI